MSRGRLANLIAFDDAPFPRGHRGDVSIVGVVYSDRRLDGLLTARVRKDGANGARTVIRTIGDSKFANHAQLVLLQGIAFAGFNVVDVHAVHRELGIPVLVVARRQPDLTRIRRALLRRVPGGRRKWAILERLGPMEPLEGVHVQRIGLTSSQARWVLRRHTLHGQLPEPLRVAHLIAGGMTTGESRGRA